MPPPAASARSACQWAKHLGATVIGTTTSPDKVELAKANGCAHVLNSKDAGWEKQVREITGGKGVPVVYDSIGKDTFMAGLDCLSAARHHGDLWQCLGPGRSFLAVDPGGQGLAVRHPADPGALHPHRRRNCRTLRRRSVRGDCSPAR